MFATANKHFNSSILKYRSVLRSHRSQSQEYPCDASLLLEF